MNEPSTLIYYGIVLIFLAPLVYAGYYFIRNTIKNKDWNMFIYVGSLALVITGFFIYVYYWF